MYISFLVNMPVLRGRDERHVRASRRGDDQRESPINYLSSFLGHDLRPWEAFGVRATFCHVRRLCWRLLPAWERATVKRRGRLHFGARRDCDGLRRRARCGFTYRTLLTNRRLSSTTPYSLRMSTRPMIAKEEVCQGYECQHT